MIKIVQGLSTKNPKEEKELSNSKFIASILSENLDITAKEAIATQLLTRNQIKASVKKADTDSKTIIATDKKELCISYFQIMSEPDKVVRYLKKRLQ